MDRVVLACLCLVACQRGPAARPAARPPVAAACRVDRVGRVTVTGAQPEEVAPLAVLEGTLDDPARTARIARVATDLLRVRGYARAHLEVTRSTGCGVELHVDVHRGTKFRIARIAFATSDAFPPAERLATVEDGLGTVNTLGGAYVADRLQRALAVLTRRYHDAGWLAAAIGAPRATFDAQHGEVSIEVPVHAGKRFRIGSVVARGGAATARAIALQSLGLRGGQWYDARALRAGLDRARRKLDRRLELRIQVAAERLEIDLEAVLGAHR